MNAIYKNISGDFYSNGIFVKKDSKLKLQSLLLSTVSSSYGDFITDDGFKITLKANEIRKRLRYECG